MRKLICSLAILCTVGAAAFLGACNKCDSCTDNQDKAAVKTDAQGTPAAAKCSGSCSGKCTAGKKAAGTSN